MASDPTEKERLAQAAGFFDAPAFYEPLSRGIDDIRTRHVGRNLILVGDQTRDVRDGFAPVGVRVSIAAAHEANAVTSILLGEEL